jgi:vacuolar-type H+-ATPase subunit H
MPTNDQGWTVQTLFLYFEALRQADNRLRDALRDSDTKLREADQRALTIKETADSEARKLSRADQTYKDEQANKLREQIASERNLYVRQEDLAAVVERVDALIKPMTAFMSAQAGRSQGFGSAGNLVYVVVGLILTVIGIWVGSR